MVELFSICSHDINKEPSIILISNGNNFSIITLLDKVHLDVNSIVTLLEFLLISLETVSLHLKMLVFLVDNSNSALGIVSNDHVDDIVLGVNSCSQGEILE